MTNTYTLEEVKQILRETIGGKVILASDQGTWDRHNHQNQLKFEQIVRACDLLGVDTLSASEND